MLSNLVSASSLRKIRCGHQPHVSAMFENWYSIRRRTNWTKRGTKYLGFHLQAKLPFRLMIDSQFIKLRKGYEIMKWIHRQFSASIRLIIRFWNTYLWPHLNMMATIYFLLSFTVQDRVTAFYRRCQRLINCLFECSPEEICEHFHTPTLDQKLRRCLPKRL